MAKIEFNDFDEYLKQIRVTFIIHSIGSIDGQN